ncbi:MAG: S-methyl-5-thioribose-1-phosphate isomerase [Chloroflexi bacterium]|nr:S-methyl-5-thioribose-1-phosphate isomerase [Chloroflexota bacterium]
MRTVEFQNNALRLIDQTVLPGELRVIECRTPGEVRDAIRTMKVRGAPAIGAAAAYGMALAAQALAAGALPDALATLRAAGDDLKSARPTAVNLAWAVDRMLRAADATAGQANGVDALAGALLAEADAIAEEDVATNRQIGAYGNTLIPRGASILTHCNTGSLATVEYGTALGVIRAAHGDRKEIHVFVDETRPFLQGARLTAWELDREGIPQTLISDNMAGHFMRRGAVDLAIVGADRITANGDVANKIGTYTLAVLCKEHGLPFYVAAPTSTVDLALANGDDITIEERSSDEVTQIAGMRIAPAGVRAAHPAFDVTPHRLVTAIITEQGVLRPPFEPALQAAVAAAEAARQTSASGNEETRVRA